MIPGKSGPFKLPEALLHGYREGLQLYVNTLRGAELAVAHADLEATKTVRKVAHLLRGSGGTYGIHALTEAAALAEEASPEDLSQALRALIDCLERESRAD